MSPQTVKTAPTLGGCGLQKASCLAADDSNNIQTGQTSQDVRDAKRDLLREFVYEAAQGAQDYSEAVQNFVACDDTAGIEYSARKFVAFAREVARGCRELIGAPEGGVP
jgi:hypothetical protein